MNQVMQEAMQEAPRVDLGDTQRLIVSGYGNRPVAVYALLRIVDARLSKAYLRECLPEVGSGAQAQRLEDRNDPRACRIALAFTHAGLRALGLDGKTLSTFIPEFQQGMASPHRARVLGDLGNNASEHWRWGGPDGEVHVLYAAFACDDAALDWPARKARLCAETSGMTLVDHVRATLQAREPFGFLDGLSQPHIADCDTSRVPGAERDRIRAGEFILGYRNEFGQFPASPHVVRERDPENRLATVLLSQRGDKDLGKNGSFLVVRELEQNVEAFAALPIEQAERMVGRTRDGEPLSVSAWQRSRSGRDQNDFGYYAEDRAGLRCPLGAHVRRANPRDALADEALGVTPERAIELANQHRILRRSRVFQRERCTGLFFLCFNTNLDRQFEFVQQTWIDNPKFSGLSGERDPLLSNHLSPLGASFTTRPGSQRECVAGLQAFVDVRGGAYFFMPGMRALGYLANLTP